MKPEEIARAVQSASSSRRQKWVSMLTAAKRRVFVPLAILGMPYFRLRGYKGLYLSCIAKRVNA